MIVVDSSVWIDYFNGSDTPQTAILDELLGVEPLAIGGLILTEVLQGFRKDGDFRTAKRLLMSLTVYELLGTEQVLKKRGITIRKTADVIIATFCIDKRTRPAVFRSRFRFVCRALGIANGREIRGRIAGAY
ncbi:MULTISPECIES: type II toxin-antitoxin system VapC family toxin [Methylocaldum]|uniref:type II toxin-antitoxin system VapC family toxin n=1 Tax=Methylocaldum sp. RMAD-M TaxID=2806557 RepID=UPI001B4B85F7|nr:VapC toxin family PIN domain ribonuclease [Methylocaldum sp. RMAD-M]MBP1151949.1 putative nucleic acid-binding protein [Methylocaldum sp. RMAD-M]